jgi:hypothetical protein
VKATVEGGLLDRILKTPVGASCTISRDEELAIALALRDIAPAGAAPAIIELITLGRPFPFLGRTLLVT